MMTGPNSGPGQETGSAEGPDPSETLPRDLVLGAPVSLSEPMAGGLLPGQLIGHYVLGARIGSGAMGVVYEAFDAQLGRKVAIKILRALSDEQLEEMLLREARAAASLEHERFVRVYALEAPHGGPPYMVMERLRGTTLAAWLEQRHALRAKLLVFIAILEGMAHAHQRGIVHRDLKPENIFLTDQYQVKILDLGLAGLYNGPRTSTQARAGLPVLEAEPIVGTPQYVAPEVWCGGHPAPGADVWALGVMLYQALSQGQHPFWMSGDGLLANRDRVLAGSWRALTRTPEPLAMVVRRALQREPKNRFADAGQMLAALVKSMKGAGLSLPISVQLADVGSVSGSGHLSGWRLPWFALIPVLAGGLMALWVILAWQGTPQEVLRTPPPGMIFIPGGKFMMGSSPTEARADYEYCRKILGDSCRQEIYERQQPERWVELAPYFLDETEVTNERFANWLYERARRLKFDAAGLVHDTDGLLLADLDQRFSGLEQQGEMFRARSGWENMPVVLVTWDAAARYCQTYDKRLPTEAEWELAARGQERRSFPWGEEEPSCDGVVFARREGGRCEATRARGPAPVRNAIQDRTPLGVLGLGGNAAEWVMDVYQPHYPVCSTPCRDPAVRDGDIDQRIFRGGNWYMEAHGCRGAGRGRSRRDEPSSNVGFRCAASARR